jgi:hypothetical protein
MGDQIEPTGLPGTDLVEPVVRALGDLRRVVGLEELRSISIPKDGRPPEPAEPVQGLLTGDDGKGQNLISPLAALNSS